MRKALPFPTPGSRTMQVRAIEFQENFRLVTLEAARQQSVINRGASEGSSQAAGPTADQRLMDLQRPVPSAESEPDRIIGGEGRSTGRQQNTGRRAEEDQEEATDDRGLPQGKSIDLFA
jgi:hypothetical protein